MSAAVVDLRRRRTPLIPVAGAAALTRLSDDAFEEVVCGNAFVHSRDADTWQRLLSPGLIRRTYEALRRIHERNLRAIRRRRAEWQRFTAECEANPIDADQWAAAQRDHDDRRRRAANFTTAIQNALAEVKHARKQINKDDAYGKQFYRERLRQVAVAIYRHRAALTDSDIIAEAHDHDLWRTLETVTVPTGPSSEPTTLLTMFERHWS
jgi:hypothetical protein